jgi:hypothetical protein
LNVQKRVATAARRREVFVVATLILMVAFVIISLKVIGNGHSPIEESQLAQKTDTLEWQPIPTKVTIGVPEAEGKRGSTEAEGTAKEEELQEILSYDFESGDLSDLNISSNSGKLPVLADDQGNHAVRLGFPKLSTIQTGQSEWDNYISEVKVRMLPAPGIDKVVIHMMARYGGLGNYYDLVYQNGKFRIMKNVNNPGAGTSLGEAVDLPSDVDLTDGEYHKLGFKVSGNTLSGYVDDQFLLSVTDNHFQRGSIAVQTWAPVDSDLTVYVDDLQVLAKKKDIEKWGTVLLTDTSKWRETEDTIEGWDWSLPPQVTPIPYSGIMGAPAGSIPGKRIVSIKAYWNKIEAEEGKYDFESVKQQIRAAGARGEGVLLGMRTSVYDMKDLSGKMTPEHVEREISAPRWLVEKYGVPLVEEQPVTNIATPFQIINMDVTDERFHQKYLKLMQELGASGIPAMPEVMFTYIYKPSRTRGEEGEMSLIGKTGEIYKERLQAIANAYGSDNRHKLMYTGSSEAATKYVYDLGMGQRNGFIEMYLGHTQSRQIGQDIDSNGYLFVDESLPPIAENRAFGDENEEYSSTFVPRFGPFESFPHRYRESMLRALQMRRNFLWSDTNGMNPGLLHFVSLELGRNIHNTPDAWVYLRESYVSKNGSYTPVKNFERWLHQRDGQGSTTTPTMKVMQGLAQLPGEITQNASVTVPKELKFVDYTARSTDFKQGNSNITFALDDRFLSGGPHRVALKVTYHDIGSGAWNLIYPTAQGEQQIRRVANSNTGKLKTITFFLDDIHFNAKGMDTDFVISSDQGDAVISFVRIIKL